MTSELVRLKPWPAAQAQPSRPYNVMREASPGRMKEASPVESTNHLGAVILMQQLKVKAVSVHKVL